MRKETCAFCPECRTECSYELRKVRKKKFIKEKEYAMEFTAAFCRNCGEELNIPGIMDQRSRELDAQYREMEELVSVSDIEKMMDIYNIGKAPLSLALGFGEITVTRYLQGQIPSKEYSDVIRKALESPEYLIERLKESRDKIGETAYKKAMTRAEELKEFFSLSEKMILTISYIFARVQEITPLALQKVLYYVQGIYMVHFRQPLFEEDCQAWVHGPVYESVYDMFKTFRYDPIEDNRFALFQNRFKELSDEEKKIIDLVLDTFGMYSGKTLECITHQEDPWKTARDGYPADQPSRVIIPKEDIMCYFDCVNKKHNLLEKDGLIAYIEERLQSC